MNDRILQFESPKRHQQYVEFRAFLDSYKMEHGCIKCGWAEHPAALIFDHRDPRTKLVKVSSMFTYTWDKIHAEIAKCDVMCANCHQIKSYEEDQNGVKARQRLFADAGEPVLNEWTLFTASVSCV